MRGLRFLAWIAPLVPAAIALGLAIFGKASAAHWALATLSVALGFYSLRTRRIFNDVAPLLAVAFGYDLLRYVRPLFVSEDRVLGCGLRNVELAVFSAGPNTTWGEALAARHAPAWDLLAAVPYTIFIYVVFGYGAYLFFRDRARMRRYVLSFAVANYLAFAVWLLWPAAPPWYLHQHGCGIELATLPDPGGLARVDALLGIHYFSGFYGRAASVFGALPSLHCAYPLIGLITAFRVARWRTTRAVHLLYVVSMPLAALYLDHHWVLDVVAGFATAVASVWLADRWLDWTRARTADVSVAPLAFATIAAEGERSRVG